MKKTFTDITPLDISDGWMISDPVSEHMDGVALTDIYRDVYADDKTWAMKSLLVFRNGKLVAESYLKDEADRTVRDAIWSCTKQVNAIITGIALDRGYIHSIYDSVGRYLPEYIAKHPDKKEITIQHLLTMTSGIAYDNGTDSDVLRQHKTSNSLDYVLGIKMDYDPGEIFKYKDSDPQILSGIIQSATGKPLDEFGREVVFEPLGVTNYEWVRYSDGVTLGSFGILTTPRELAKIAQCVLDSGLHNGLQIMPKDWLKEMLAAKIPNAHNNAAFGYLWWSFPLDGYYFMWGHGGQYAFIVPAKRLLVISTSLSQVDDDVSLPVEYIADLVKRIAATAN